MAERLKRTNTHIMETAGIRYWASIYRTEPYRAAAIYNLWIWGRKG